MRILIATSIYPPDIGGSAQYARNLYDTWKKQGHDVAVATYTWEWAVPPGVRHLLILYKNSAQRLECRPHNSSRYMDSGHADHARLQTIEQEIHSAHQQ